jgi:dTDP-4-amino-4,6-dideoxygalactose transaminase
MKIPIAKPYIDGNEQRAVREVLEGEWISLGPKCGEFESALSSYVGVKHARAVNSGTSAIHLALTACGVRPGDEVIVPAFTCAATLNPVEHIDARPVLVDIETNTFGLDVSKLVDTISPRTRAIIAVHLFGLPSNIEEITRIASQHRLKVIEDAALGLGARVGNRSVGSFGHVACMSFHPRKMITTGEGGMILTNSEDVAHLVSKLRNYGASVPAWDRHRSKLFDLPNYENAGYNYKLTDIQASIGLAQMKKLPRMLQMRRQIARRYNEELTNLPWLQLPQEGSDQTHAYQSYVCLLNTYKGSNSDELENLRYRFWRHLLDCGIDGVQGAQAMTRISYYRRKYGWRHDDFPVALLADKASVALPIYPDLSEESQNHIIRSIRSFQI